MIRAVLDTSVLLSAERHELLYLGHQGAYEIIWSAFLISEVVRVRTEMAIRNGQDREIYRSRINRFVHEVAGLADIVDYTLVEGGSYASWLKDPDDEPLLATALIGGAQFVVSWNTRDFPPTSVYAGVRYLIPPAFFAEIYGTHPLQARFDSTHYRAL